MLAFTSLFFLAVIATTIDGLSVGSRLIARSAEPEDNQVQRHVTIIKTASVTCTNSVTVIQSSCKNEDVTTIQQTITTLQVTIQSVQETVSSSDFNHQVATTQKETIVTIITAYSTVVQTLASHPKAKDGCDKRTLRVINEHVQRVIDVYVSFHIDLTQEIKNKGGIDEQAFSSFNLQLNLSAESEQDSQSSDESEDLDSQDSEDN